MMVALVLPMIVSGVPAMVGDATSDLQKLAANANSMAGQTADVAAQVTENLKKAEQEVDARKANLKEAQGALDKAKGDVAQQAGELNSQAQKAVSDAKDAMGKTTNFVDKGLQSASAAIRGFTVKVEAAFADLKGKLPRADMVNLVQVDNQQLDSLSGSANSFAGEAEKVATQVTAAMGGAKAEGDKADAELKNAKEKGDAELAGAMQGVKGANDAAAAQVGDVKKKLDASLGAVGQTKAATMAALTELKTALEANFAQLESQFPKA
jgi:ElaB/YqjD/DUF883 family membrane-anchored ribosome-binding protein